MTRGDSVWTAPAPARRFVQGERQVLGHAKRLQALSPRQRCVTRCEFPKSPCGNLSRRAGTRDPKVHAGYSPRLGRVGNSANYGFGSILVQKIRGAVYVGKLGIQLN